MTDDQRLKLRTAFRQLGEAHQSLVDALQVLTLQQPDSKLRLTVESLTNRVYATTTAVRSLVEELDNAGQHEFAERIPHDGYISPSTDGY